MPETGVTQAESPASGESRQLDTKMKKQIIKKSAGAFSASQNLNKFTVLFGTVVRLTLQAMSITMINIALTVSAVAADRPDLKPGRPSGWTAPVEVTTIASKPVIRASWFNDSRVSAIGSMSQVLSIDGRGLVGFWQERLDGGWGSKTSYYRIGLIAKGRHTAKLSVDDTKGVAESSETNNTYSVTFNYDGLRFPLPNKIEHRKVTHGFGRPWNADRTKRIHNGIDLQASSGTSVYATYDGKVLGTGSYTGWGEWIVVGHDQQNDGAYGWTSLYLHVTSKVKKDDQVFAGDKIAEVAALSTGDHFHFGIRLGPTLATKEEIDLAAKGALASESRYILSNVPLFPERYVNPIAFIEGDFVALEYFLF